MARATPEARRLLLDGTLALAKVEANGFRIDVARLERTSAEIGEKIKALQEEMRKDEVYAVWRKTCGDRMVPGSREQLARVLFDVMGFPEPGKTETGKTRADEAALMTVNLPFVRTFVRCEKLKKLRNTYLEGVRREVCDGYLHCSFDLNTAVSFRSASSAPNFQNIPTRDPEIGECIRSCFIPRKGRRIVERDFSGIEVRVAACYNKDPVLIRYIKDPTTDMHRDTACDLFFLEPGQVEKKTTRDWAKNRFVFPQFYGSVYFQCAPHLWEAVEEQHGRAGGKPFISKEPTSSSAPGPPASVKAHLAARGITGLGDCVPGEDPTPGTFAAHVKAVEDRFWKERFTVYSEWKKRWWHDYQANLGYRTLTGFWIGPFNRKGTLGRNDVINYGIQGSAFHVLLWSLVRIQRLIEKRKMRTKIVGQIHDSIIADVPDGEVQDYLEMTRKVTSEDVLKHWDWIIVPLDTEAELTEVEGNWFKKKTWARGDSGRWAEEKK